MSLSLYKITQRYGNNTDQIDFIKHLEKHIDDYKILGKYEIDKHAQLSISLMRDMEERNQNDCAPCCFEGENKILNEKHFQVLFEMVQTHEGIPDGLVQNMDDHNKNVAEIWNKDGVESAVEVMTRGLRNGTMSYSQMRELYG